MKTRENNGFWMVPVPGAVAWLCKPGRPVTPDSIHDELDRSGLLDSVKQLREPPTELPERRHLSG